MDDVNKTALERGDFSDLATATLYGDVRDALLDRIKTLQKPWAQLGQFEQIELIRDCQKLARHLVVGAVDLVAANGWVIMQATLESCTVKDGIKGVLQMSRHDPQRHALVDAVGKRVFVTLADVEEHMGEKAEAKPDAQEPRLPLGDAPVGAKGQ
jgi:hypothetical protein